MDNCEVHGPSDNSSGRCSCGNIDNAAKTVDSCVLAYCQSFLHKYDVNTVAAALDVYFSDEDLVFARKLIRDNFLDLIQGLEIGKVKTRNMSTQKASSSAIAYDITEAVYTLVNKENPPSFVVHDITKLPIVKPDMIEKKSIAERLVILENQFSRMEEWKNRTDKNVTENSVKIGTIEDKIDNVPQNSMRFPDVGSSNSFAAKVKQPLWGSIKRSAPNQPARTLTSNTLAPASSQESLLSQREGDSNNDGDDEWQQQGQQKRKMLKQQKKNNDSKKKAAIQGSAAGTNFKAGLGPNRDLWIYNVDKEMDDADLRKFIEDGGSGKTEKVHIRFWEPRYEAHWDTKKFRITIGLSDYERVFKAEFWPENIWVRKYWVNFEKERERLRSKKKDDSTASTTS